MKQFNLQKYLANPSRQVVTRNGRKVRIVCTDRKGDKPIVALVHNENEGQEYGYTFYPDGKYFIDKDDEFDLFFAPEKHEGWINVYKWGDDYRYTGDVFSSKEKALKSVTGCDNVATIKIEWEE